MSTNCGFPEVAGIELVDFVARKPDCVLFIKGPYDLRLDGLMKSLAEAEGTKYAIAWMSKSAAPRHLAHFRISGDHNIIVFRDGLPVKRLIGIPPAYCLCSAVVDALSGAKPSPPPEA